MKVGDTHYRTVWLEDDGWAVGVIDQTLLPHDFRSRRIESVEQAAEAIRDMVVRGAPLIGATAAYGMCLAVRDKAQDAVIDWAYGMLLEARPTAVNLRWALNDMRHLLLRLPVEARREAAYARAAEICDEDVDTCAAIGRYGEVLIREAWDRGDRKRTVNVLTHCNAGWLATVDWGTALAPIYMAHDNDVPVHVWVDETRPRNQGASLTAWELKSHGVPHTVIVDNAGGHLMQEGQVDLCITGTDRTAANGDVCNKIGTYLKALAAHDNGVPFYVALPHTTIDWSLASGVGQIPIEQREASEVTHLRGLNDDGEVVSVALTPEGVTAANYAFDVTPARLVTGLVTERGICPASREGLLKLYPEHAR